MPRRIVAVWFEPFPPFWQILHCYCISVDIEVLNVASFLPNNFAIQTHATSMTYIIIIMWIFINLRSLVIDSFVYTLGEAHWRKGFSLGLPWSNDDKRLSLVPLSGCIDDFLKMFWTYSSLWKGQAIKY